jgi:hypothetical protein
MRVDEYKVLDEAVLNGILSALNRVEKKVYHEDQLNDGDIPYRQALVEELHNSITNEICEYFSFKEVEVDNGLA